MNTARARLRELASLSLATAALLMLVVPRAARAEVKNARADGFYIELEAQVAKAPGAVFAALGEIGRWWNGDHTYSGSARNLTLPLVAGGCFCERWKKGTVEHGRVVHVRAGELLRLQSALGPLQALPVNAVLTLTLAGGPQETTLKLDYRVGGGGDQELDKLSKPVDGVLAGQFARLVRFVETGKPE